LLYKTIKTTTVVAGVSVVTEQKITTHLHNIPI